MLVISGALPMLSWFRVCAFVLLELCTICSDADAIHDAQVIGQSFVFYEIQRAGRLPPDTRLPWRADTLKKGDGSLDGDYQGGYFDAGDHNKFQLPTSYATARLAWLAHSLQGWP